MRFCSPVWVEAVVRVRAQRTGLATAETHALEGGVPGSSSISFHSGLRAKASSQGGQPASSSGWGWLTDASFFLLRSAFTPSFPEFRTRLGLAQLYFFHGLKGGCCCLSANSWGPKVPGRPTVKPCHPPCQSPDPPSIHSPCCQAWKHLEAPPGARPPGLALGPSPLTLWA